MKTLFDLLFIVGRKENWSLNKVATHLVILGLWTYYNNGFDLTLEELGELCEATKKQKVKL